MCTNPAPTSDSHYLPLHCGWQPGNEAIGTHNGGQMIWNWTLRRLKSAWTAFVASQQLFLSSSVSSQKREISIWWTYYHHSQGKQGGGGLPTLWHLNRVDPQEVQQAVCHCRWLDTQPHVLPEQGRAGLLPGVVCCGLPTPHPPVDGQPCRGSHTW